MKKLKDTIKLVGSAVILAISLIFYQWFNPEIFMEYEGQTVGLEEIDANPIGDYAGKIAGENIPHLQGVEDFEQLIHSEYATVTTDTIIPTGIYGLTSWEDYAVLRKGTVKIGGRRTTRTNQVKWDTRWPLNDAHYYQQYYLVRLPDSNYCLVQLSGMYEWKLRTEKEVNLPIGRKETISGETRELFSDICNEYGVEPSYYLFMIDNEWIGEKRDILLFIRVVAAAGVFFLLATVFLMIIEKVFKREE